MEKKNISHKNKFKEYVKKFVDKITAVSSLSKSSEELKIFANIRKRHKQLFQDIKKNLKPASSNTNPDNYQMSKEKQKEKDKGPGSDRL